MRVLHRLAVTAIAATLVVLATGEASFPERLVRAEARAAIPEAASALAGEPATVSAVFLEYADDPALVLAARLALHRHPVMAREILPLYGTRPRFRAVLARYGPAVLPPIHYFLNNEVPSLALMRAADRAASDVSRAARRWWNDDATPPPERERPLTPVDRGWYAVAFIEDDGHDFLGQFTLGDDGQVAWVQTERLLEGASAFLGSGVRGLERRLQTGAPTGASDYLWAGLDLAVVLGGAKLLRAGRGVTATARAGGAAAALTARAALATRTLARGTRTALRIGRYGLPLAIGYAVVRHPALISSMARHAAEWLGLPPLAFAAAVWGLILLPVVWLVAGLWRRVLHPLARLLAWLARGLATLARRPDRPPVRGAPAAWQTAPDPDRHTTEPMTPSPR